MAVPDECTIGFGESLYVSLLPSQGIWISHQGRDPCLSRCQPMSNWSGSLPLPVDANNEVAISLVFGQVKVAPINPVSILRLKLCRAVLAVQAVEKILKELNMMASEVTFNMDSRVVLGYIRNKSRRFYVYVANCMEFIGKILTPD